LDRIYNGRCVEILDKQVDNFSCCAISFDLRCNNLEYFKDIPDRSQTSTPDFSVAAERSTEHSKCSEVEEVFRNCPLRLWFDINFLSSTFGDNFRV
jgi:hypothetical protein